MHDDDDDDDGEIYFIGQRGVKRSRCLHLHGSRSRRLKSAASGRQAVRPNLWSLLQAAAAGYRAPQHGARSAKLYKALLVDCRAESLAQLVLALTQGRGLLVLGRRLHERARWAECR